MKKIKKIGLRPAFFIITLIFISSVISNAYAFRAITSRKNRVTVNVSPEQLAKGGPVKFKVRMSTHSVELGEDMIAVSELKDDQGQGYRPVNWQGSPPGGHHRKGVIEFPELKGNPGSVTLIIRNIANVPERVFKWELKK